MMHQNLKSKKLIDDLFFFTIQIKSDDPKAPAKFMLVTKAYECLTNEEVKENCMKYGNPDGQGSFNIAIALPSALLKKEHHVLVLSIFFITILIVVPAIVMCWYSDSSQYDIDGVLIYNKQMFFWVLNENTSIKGSP